MTSARVGEGDQEEVDTCGHGGGGQAKLDVHIWFKTKVFNFNCSVEVRIMTPKSINMNCN